MLTINERNRRWNSIKKLMENKNIDFLIVAGREGAIGRGFIRYLSDWHLWGGIGYMVFSPQGEPTLILGSESQTMWARAIDWVSNVRFFTPPIQGVIEVVGDNLDSRRIGVVGLGSYMLHEDSVTLLNTFKENTIIDLTSDMEEIVMIKSNEEITLLKETADAVEAAMIRFRDELRPGRTEREVVACAWETAKSRGILDGIAHISNTFPPFIHPPTDRIIQEDDIIKFSMEMPGGNGYWIELSGVFSFKQPDDMQLKVFNTTLRAVNAVKKILVPGTVGKEIAETVERIFKEDGWDDTTRIIWDAHGIGLDVIQYPIIRNLNETVLQEDMIISLHPGLTVGKERLGFYIQDNYVVKPGGAIQHSNWEHKWHVIDIK